MTKLAAYTLGIKKIEETSYSEQMSLIIHLLHCHNTIYVILCQ